MTTLAGVRASKFGPVLLGHHVPRGVLGDFGLAAWEMPETTNGAGQLAWLHATNLSEFEAFLRENVAASPTIAGKKFLEEMRDAVLVSPSATMALADLANGGYPGNSLCLQNLYAGFSRSAGGVDSVYDFSADVQGILAQWTGGKRLWINVGLGNTPEFYAGELRFNAHYSIKCRPAQNVFLPYVNASYLGLGTDDIVYVTQAAGADATTRLWPHTVYDVTLPEVVELCRQHLIDMATELGSSVRWIIEGECFPWLPNNQPGVDKGLCAQRPILEICENCEPLGPWSDHHTEGFVRWLQNHLGLDIDDLNDRWDTNLPSFEPIQPHVNRFCGTAAKAVDDYQRFCEWLLKEATLLHCHAVRQTAPNAVVTPLWFNENGMEIGALSGDVPCVGNWEGRTEQQYLADRTFNLHSVANVARLSGAAPVYHVSSPTFTDLSPDWEGPDGTPQIMRARRAYEPRHLGWFLREVLTAGAVHIGYRKAPGGDSFDPLPASKTAVFDCVAQVLAAHPTQLAGMGSWQRLAIHCEDLLRYQQPGWHVASARAAFHLAALWREEHRPCAVFSSPRWMHRPQSRWQLQHSLVVVPYHSQVDTLVDTYRTLFPEGAPGGALLVRESYTGTVPDYVDPSPIEPPELGPGELPPPNFLGLYRVRTDDEIPVLTNVWLLQVTPRRPCLGDQAYAELASLVESILPQIEAEISGTFVTRPVSVESSVPADIATNVVSDGVNWTVAVSNLNTSAARSVTLTVAPEIATELDVTYPITTVSLAAGETQLITIQAVATGVNLAPAITTVQGNIEALELDGYDARGIAAATDLLAQAGALILSHPGRSLALLTAAARMVQLRLSVTAGEITIDARRPGMPTEAVSLGVSGARCVLVWPLNGREEQSAIATTDGAGTATLVVGSPQEERWDFDSNDVAAPPSYAGSVAEVYVTDPITGATGCASITLP